MMWTPRISPVSLRYIILARPSPSFSASACVSESEDNLIGGREGGKEKGREGKRGLITGTRPRESILASQTDRNCPCHKADALPCYLPRRRYPPHLNPPTPPSPTFELALNEVLTMPRGKPCSLASSSAFSWVTPTKDTSGCVKQAAGTDKWLRTWGLPHMFSTAEMPWERWQNGREDMLM